MVGSAETTLSAYRPTTRQALVPLLAYKAPFVGEWFAALTRHEPDPHVRARLARMNLDTVRETIELLAVVSAWERLPVDDDSLRQHAANVHRRALHDLMRLKEGSAEVVLLTGMVAPTAELRDRLVALADVDRVHADELRELMGAAALAELRGRPEQGGALGAHEGRVEGSTLSESVRDRLAQLESAGVRPTRLVVSPTALRHLRDEGVGMPEGIALGLPVDVEFGWRGECFSIQTDARVTLAEIISQEMTSGSRSA